MLTLSIAVATVSVNMFTLSVAVATVINDNTRCNRYVNMLTLSITVATVSVNMFNTLKLSVVVITVYCNTLALSIGFATVNTVATC